MSYKEALAGRLEPQATFVQAPDSVCSLYVIAKWRFHTTSGESLSLPLRVITGKTGEKSRVGSRIKWLGDAKPFTCCPAHGE